MGTMTMLNKLSKDVEGGFGTSDQEADDAFDNVIKITEELSECAEVGKGMVLSKLDESQFVDMLNTMSGILASHNALNGKVAILLAQKEGSLQPFVHSVVLATLGILVEEGVL